MPCSASPSQRAVFLAEACGDNDDLRAEVERLLEYETDFMDQPTVVSIAENVVQPPQQLPVGQRLGRYQILQMLGAGGMGEVYLARDTELDRAVALKILAADFAADQQRMQRFVQEAKTASALNHPNIITIHEVGQAAGSRFIATEYINGETLRQRLTREPLSLAECFEVAVQTAAALSAAHEAKIVHRDIKPENIMLRPDGLVKVLDFGLAKLTEKETSAASDPNAPTRLQLNTAPGVVMGTFNYMSPEQSRGKAVDLRTDIWSFGVVLYEMITGRLPFAGETGSDVIAAILKSEPSPLNAIAPETPAELQRIVRKALRKDRDERYHTVKDLLTDLKTLQRELAFAAEMKRSVSLAQGNATAASKSDADTTTGFSSRTDSAAGPRTTSSAEYLVNNLKARKRGVVLTAGALLVLIAMLAGIAYFGGTSPTAIDSLAVLPLTNVGGDANTDYLSDGVTESLIDSLSQLPNLAVKSRSSVFRYKGREIDPETVGHELGVRAVLSGRLVQHGDALTITLELVDARTSNHLWGAKYERQLSDLVVIQGEIVREVSEKLRLHLTNADQQRATRGYSTNTEAYQLYLKGRYSWNKRTTDAIRKSIEYYQQAIAKDPGYALAYAGLADSYVVPSAALPPGEKYPKAKAAAYRALELDNSLAEPHAALARAIFEYDWDFAAAEKEFRQAVSMNPNYATAHQFFALFLTLTGHREEGIAEARRALALDPLSLSINATLGYVYIYAGQNAEAQAQFKKITELDNNFADAHEGLTQVYLQQGMEDAAIGEILTGISRTPPTPEALSQLRGAYSSGGVEGFWRKQLELRLAAARAAYITPVAIARVYAKLGETAEALRFLELGLQEHSFGMHELRNLAEFKKLHGNQRFEEILRRMGH